MLYGKAKLAGNTRLFMDPPVGHLTLAATVEHNPTLPTAFRASFSTNAARFSLMRFELKDVELDVVFL